MTTTIVVFARAPVAGAAKTRLIPALGAAGAARLHARLVEHALGNAVAAATGPVELCCAPDTDHAFFDDCSRRFGVALTTQAAGDLGERMAHAFARVLSASGTALLIGTDCPALTPDYLRRAAEALAAGCAAVFGPAEDGGYVLVGLAAPAPALFEGMPWSTPAVMRETRARCVRLGLRAEELPMLWDVDRPEDLSRLRADPSFAGLASAAR